MKNIGFIGLGIMGKPMVHNLLKAGFSVTVFDVVTDAVNLMTAEGAAAAHSAKRSRCGRRYGHHDGSEWSDRPQHSQRCGWCTRRCSKGNDNCRYELGDARGVKGVRRTRGRAWLFFSRCAGQRWRARCCGRYTRDYGRR